MFADIILPLNLPQILTYGVPHEMQDHLRLGMRVEVELGKNKQYAGIVERMHNEKPELYLVKPIRGIIDSMTPRERNKPELIETAGYVNWAVKNGKNVI